jgi:4-amino-4-deoxy-L-arabinose transferase-like glycosyltransferase
MKSNLINPHWPLFALAGVILIACYRLWIIQVGLIPIDLEEVYYLSWSDKLDWGYFSKPPMIAWLLGLFSQLFGESPLAIKSVSVILHTAAAYWIYVLAVRLYNPLIAGWSALVFQLLPVIGLVSLFSTTDAPLMLFWVATLWAFHHAVETNAWRWWLLTGLCAGLGLLSKYTMGVLAVGLLLYLLLEGRYRLLFSARLWLGIGVALLVWSPNLYWLVQNDFITLSHTRHISGTEQIAGGWLTLSEFIGGQIGVFGPVFFVALLFWLWRPTVWHLSANRLLLLASLPLVVLISIQAYRFEANINWASPAYIGLVMVSVYWLHQHARKVLWLGIMLNILLISAIYHYHALANAFEIELRRGNDPYFKRLGWLELGGQLKSLRQQYPNAALLSDNRKLLAFMAYHSRDEDGRPVIRSWNPNGEWRHQYDLRQNIVEYPQGEFIWLSEQPINANKSQSFSQCVALQPLHIRVYDDLQRTIYLNWCQNFQGYKS